MTSPCSLNRGTTFLHNRILYSTLGHGLNALCLRPCGVVLNLKFLLYESNAFHLTISCTDQPCNDLFNDSLRKDKWSNILGSGNIYCLQDKHKSSICRLYVPNHCREFCQPSNLTLPSLGENCFQRGWMVSSPSCPCCNA